LAVATLLIIGLVVVASPSAGASLPTAKPKTRTAALLFVVQGTTGTYARTSDGTAVLTLTGADQLATWFTDRPDRQAGTIPLPEALTMIGFDTNPPYAVATVRLADTHHDALAVKLEAPSYDQAAGTLAFRVTPLSNPGSNLRGFDRRLDKGLAPNFGDVALFIDDTTTPVASDGTPAIPGSGPAQSPTPPPNAGDYLRALHLYFRNLPETPSHNPWGVTVHEVLTPDEECAVFSNHDGFLFSGDSELGLQYRVVTVDSRCGFFNTVLTLQITIGGQFGQPVLTTGQVRVNKPLGKDGDVRCITAFSGATCSGWSWDQVTIRITS